MRESSSEPKQPLDFTEARRIVIETVRALPNAYAKESTSLEEAHGRVLAENVAADRDYPSLRRSLRDGFAVRIDDLPGVLRVRGEVRAGEETQPALQAGEALEIMTGAPVPDGADAVVMVEHVGRRGAEVKIERTAESGQFINERGAEARAGGVLIPQGTRIDASHIATLAMVGQVSIQVFCCPRVAILATGDEIVTLEEEPAAHQIRNSNSYMLAALVRAAGGLPAILPVARDTPDALQQLLQRGLAHDMLMVSGGVSAGKYDLVKPTLRQLGTAFRFERVRVQPGQPTAFGTCQGKPVFGLPGNPASSLITFQLFARPAIEILAGDHEPLLPLLSARFAAPFRHKVGLTRFLPAQPQPGWSRAAAYSVAGLERHPGPRESQCFSGRRPQSRAVGKWRFDPGDAEAVKELSHYNAAGDISMVDVSHKKTSKRTAAAHAFVTMPATVIAALPGNKKGDPLQVARIAGICAAKKTSELIPLCHQIPLTHVALEFEIKDDGIEITATAATEAQTGVEMEALTAASIAALTIYDMTKALDKSIEIGEIYLLEKTGGKSGAYRRLPGTGKYQKAPGA